MAYTQKSSPFKRVEEEEKLRRLATKQGEKITVGKYSGQKIGVPYRSAAAGGSGPMSVISWDAELKKYVSKTVGN